MAAPRLASLAERFAGKFEPEPNSGCWLWVGTFRKDGYGLLSNGTGNALRAHRASWLLHRGEIPIDLSVLHRCDNPACVNPEHLFLGTGRDNMTDCVQKGRNRNTRKSHCAKGHELSGDNTHLKAAPSGRTRRVCRKCNADAQRRRRCH